MAICPPPKQTNSKSKGHLGSKSYAGTREWGEKFIVQASVEMVCLPSTFKTKALTITQINLNKNMNIVLKIIHSNLQKERNKIKKYIIKY